MGIQETMRRQEEKLAAQAQQYKQHPSAAQPPSQPAVDLHAFRQIVEEVVRAELQALRAERPAQQDPQLFDMQALQTAVRPVVRAELQGIQTTLTILANAIAAQTDAMMSDDGEEDSEEDEPLSPPPIGEIDEEDQNGFPRDEDTEEEEVPYEDESEEGQSVRLPRPESPIQRLRRPGPDGIFLGSGTLSHPSAGIRRWEPQL